MTNWPDSARPGVPLCPEQDGWHWVKARSDNLKPTWREKFPAQWTAGNRHWIHGTYAPEYAAENWIYLGPCLTANEATALQKRVAELEGALRNARARYIELSDKDAAEAMAEIINEALGDVK